VSDAGIRLPSTSKSSEETDIDKCIPSLKEITLRNDACRFSELYLEIRRHRDHESDDLPLDRFDVAQRQLVCTFFILISAQNQ